MTSSIVSVVSILVSIVLAFYQIILTRLKISSATSKNNELPESKPEPQTKTTTKTRTIGTQTVSQKTHQPKNSSVPNSSNSKTNPKPTSKKSTNTTPITNLKELQAACSARGGFQLATAKEMTWCDFEKAYSKQKGNSSHGGSAVLGNLFRGRSWV